MHGPSRGLNSREFGRLGPAHFPQLLIPNYTLRQTIATYNRTEDWDELSMFALQAPNQSPGAL